MKPVVCVTREEFSKAENFFLSCSDLDCRQTEPCEALLADDVLRTNAIAAIVGIDEYSNLLYKTLPEGGVIARFGIGHDGIDKDKACEKGILVTNTPGALDDSVSEHAVFLMGCLAKNIPKNRLEPGGNSWKPYIGVELRGKKLLILGCGRIGKKTARIASFGFSMRVEAYDPAVSYSETLEKEFGIVFFHNTLEEAVEDADFISLHIPALPGTRHLIGRSLLSSLKPGCMIINTSRGSVIDESALYDVLESGKLSGAALDVFEREPYFPHVPEKDLRKLDNVLLTPHIGSSTLEACSRMASKCIQNIRAARNGRYELMDLVNPQVLNIIPVAPVYEE